MVQIPHPRIPVGPIGDLLKLIKRRFPLPIPGGDIDDIPVKPGDQDLLREKLRVQVGIMRRALGDDVAAAAGKGAGRATDDADSAYLFRPGHAIVRDEDTLRRMTDYFDRDQKTYIGNAELVPERAREVGLLVRLPARTDGGCEVLRTIEEVEAEFRRQAEETKDAELEVPVNTQERPVVTPDHLLYVTPIHGSYCPFTEPQMVRGTDPWPPRNPDSAAGQDVRVNVVDTGLWKASLTHPDTPWMDGVDCAFEDEEVVDQNDIHPYAGHGTFVAGVVQCMAPASTVDVEGALTNGGAVWESDIVEQIHDALESRGRPHLISISAGTYTRGSMALLGFQMLASYYGWDDGEETLVVAAAGNDTTDEPFYPAAFPWVLAVGSVDACGKQSTFSNYGDWVDVYARGEDLVNAFPKGTYKCHEPANLGDIRVFDGLAQWTGTSFSTPLVTGLIAARMSAKGENALDARDAVLKSATSPHGVPVVGPLS